MEQTFVFCDDCNFHQRVADDTTDVDDDVYAELQRISGGHEQTRVIKTQDNAGPVTLHSVVGGHFRGTRAEAQAEGWTQDDALDKCAVCVARDNVQTKTYEAGGFVDATGHKELGDALASTMKDERGLQVLQPFIGGWSDGPSAEAVAAANAKATKKRLARETPLETPAPNNDGEERHQ